MVPALLLLEGHGDVALGLVAALLRLLLADPAVGSVLGVVDLVLNVRGGGGLVVLDARPGELGHEELQELVMLCPACADAEDGADLELLDVGVGLIDVQEGGLVLVDLLLEHEVARKAGDVAVDEHLALLHHLLQRVVAEVVSVQDGLALGVDQLRVPQVLEGIAEVLVPEEVALVAQLHDLLEVKHILKVLGILPSFRLLLSRFGQLVRRGRFF